MRHPKAPKTRRQRENGWEGRGWGIPSPSDEGGVHGRLFPEHHKRKAEQVISDLKRKYRTEKAHSAVLKE